MDKVKIVYTDNTKKSQRELTKKLEKGWTILDSVFVGGMRVQYVIGKYDPKENQVEELTEEEIKVKEE